MFRNYPLLDKYERANFITHFLGLLGALVLIPLLFFLPKADETRTLVGLLIFALGIISMFSSSALYHLSIIPGKKRILRIWDHISIFLLIGASYTIYILIFYNSGTGLKFLGLHWILILVGVLGKLFLTGKLEIISTLSYVLLGWMVVFIYDDITQGMGALTFWYLVAGGMSYTLGVIFYVWHRLPYHHAIWHVFVIGGILGHYLSIYDALS